MREKLIETKVCNGAKKRGGMAIKLTSPAFTGLPDRMVLLPVAWIAFVETKSTGDKPRPRQRVVHAMLRKLGFKVYVIDRPEQIDEFYNDYDKQK